MMWIGIYRDAGGKQQFTDFPDAKTRSQAKSQMAEFLVPINRDRDSRFRDANMTLGIYAENVYIPYGLNGKWKGSTAITTPQRIRQYLVESDLGEMPLGKLDREILQAFLNSFADSPSSIVGHVRFDIQAICRLATTDKIIQNNPAPPKVLYTPRSCPKPKQPMMTAEQSRQALAVLDLRERAFCLLVLVAGIRPGEVIALRWPDFEHEEGNFRFLIDDRFYKGVSDDPKGGRSRESSVSPELVRYLQLWRNFAMQSEYVFPSENGLTPIKYENLWQRDIRPRFEKIGLEWADFRCMRRTNTSLMKKAGGDVKAGADQRGHNVVTSINVYTQSSLAEKAAAVRVVENLLLLA